MQHKSNMKWLWGQFLFVQLRSDVIKHSVVKKKKKGIRGLSNTHPNYNPDSKMPGCCVNSVLWFTYPAWQWWVMQAEICIEPDWFGNKNCLLWYRGEQRVSHTLGHKVGRGSTVRCSIFDQYVILRNKREARQCFTLSNIHLHRL